ncbi:MAG: hypothetical protein ACR2PT_02880 [Endozoicomonas sp.]
MSFITRSNSDSPAAKLRLYVCLFVLALAPLLSANNDAQLIELIEKLPVVLNLSNQGKAAPVYRPQDFLFGEEFEYWIDTPTGKYEPEYSFQFVELWKDKLEQKLVERNIPESAYELVIKPAEFIPASNIDVEANVKNVNQHLSKLFRAEQLAKLTEIARRPIEGRLNRPPSMSRMLDIRIGNWHSRVFIDPWSSIDDQNNIYSYELLEVHASPYRLNQTFQVDNLDYSVYDLMTLFITEIASEISALRYASGHKHLDMKNSLSNNAELMFRMLVDSENKAWLPQLFGCAQDSGSGDSFIYVSQTSDDPEVENSYRMIISEFNDLMAKGYYSVPADLEGTYFRLRMFWDIFLHSGQKPVTMRLKPANTRQVDGRADDRAEKGRIVARPESTLEYRFFPTARSGNEARLINTLLVRWFNSLHQEQLRQIPVTYTPYDPEHGRPNESIEPLYQEFIERLGLDFKEYQPLIREGCMLPPNIVPRKLKVVTDPDADHEEDDL